MKVEVHDRLEAVPADAWDQVLAQSRLRSPFLSWSWQHEWARVFAAGHGLDVRTVVDDAGTLVGVMPLYEAAPSVFRLIGGLDISDYLDLLVVAGREAEVWSALLASRAGSRAVWDLHAVPAASYTVTMLPRAGEDRGLAISATVEDRCPVLMLPASWETYLARLGGKHRHELTRKMRRFQREIPEGRAVVAAARADVETRLGDFLRLHRSSRAGKAKFMDERMETFFRSAMSVLADRNGMRLWFLDTPTGPAAAFITLEWDGTVALYNSGFDPSRAALSPGLVLLAELIRDAIARGTQRFDFLRGEERYKYEFGPVPEDVFAVRIGA